MSGVNDTTDLKLLKSARATIGDVGLSEDKVRIQVPKKVVKDLKGPVHVLVVVPGRAVEDGAWSAKDLSTVDPQAQSKMWKSVVRVSSGDVCSGTAVVVDLTSTHLYLLTNLHFWVDDTFTDHLSADFTTEIKRYLRRHPRMKTSGRKKNVTNNKDADVAKRPRRKSLRTAAMKSSAKLDKPQVVVEQLLPDRPKPEEVNRFSLDSDICWCSSAAFDFAIFEVVLPRNNKLDRCDMSFNVSYGMSVDVFGFPGAFEDQAFDHAYAIIPARITGWSGNRMVLSSLSAPGVSGSALVCTKNEVAAGYLGAGLYGSAKNERYQSYFYTFHGVIPELPSSLPRYRSPNKG
ncbi:CRN-like protein [Plasmopara halstedii]|uniref:CRN-like protein n=1 Tax=Plasmopara halstedii TaxID=4781 RepID=A0A0P1ANV4_PLAHL|nr:CRN-like protein [Plasmopara halstedii]CEG42761.1 CRN-like protein [Plasmopara halstedii]|eukprot:XP_024579130.1 CRN-like protein [Plasmopara halstedii]